MTTRYYALEAEEAMQMFAATLNERDFRRYAAVEALKLDHGGIKYISRLLNIDPKTIRKGIKEIKKNLNVDYIRKPGGGRLYIDETYPNLHEVFLEIVEAHTAGCPMNRDIKWTFLTQKEIVEKLAEKGINISEPIVSDLLKIHGFKKRKMNKSQTIKEVENRNAQFMNINELRRIYIDAGEPVVSVDTKKKEVLGSLYREGKVYSQTALEVYDHDFASLQTGLVVPHGIYDISNNHAFINIGSSRDTAEFFFDSMLHWWESYGKFQYPNASKLLIVCDGGGSNSSRHYVFKEAVHKLADKIGISVRIAHYPPYCSKYNPIEHRVFPHITRALSGVVLDNLKTVKQLIETRAKTRTGLETCANILDKVYETGKKASDFFMEKMPILFDEFLPRWNYKSMPTS
jgi:hypothetical protein